MTAGRGRAIPAIPFRGSWRQCFRAWWGSRWRFMVPAEPIAGVHALGQVANAKLETDMTAEEVMEYLNEYLPRDMAVTEALEVSMRFHSASWRFSKIYQYRIRTEKRREVFSRNFVWHLGKIWIQQLWSGRRPIWWEPMIFSLFPAPKKERNPQCAQCMPLGFRIWEKK